MTDEALSDKKPRSFTLPDGTVIQIAYSPFHAGPGQAHGLRCGRAIWWRRGGEKWVPSHWRTMHKMVDWILLCEDMADFLEGEDDSVAR